MKKRLTLKDLKQELLELKKSKISPSRVSSQTVTNDKNGSQSIITRFQHAFSLPVMFVISNLLTYGHKIPFISKILKILALWYGRTTIWRILVKLRNCFVFMNSLIGILTVFYLSGFTSDHILAGITGMGYTYVEMLTSFIKRLFYWFFDLFDQRIVPKPSGDSPFNPFAGIPSTSLNKGDGISRIYDLTNNDKSFRETYLLKGNHVSDGGTNWLWYSFLGLLMIGFLYFGYILITDPTILMPESSNRFSQNPKLFPRPSAGDDTGGDAPEITITDARTDKGKNVSDTIKSGAAFVGNGLTAFRGLVLNRLNPVNYIIGLFGTNPNEATHFDMFMERQFRMNDQDRRYYPFTPNNPFAPWHQKLKISVFGESLAEETARLNLKERCWKEYLSITSHKPETPIQADSNVVEPLETLPRWWGSGNPFPPELLEGNLTPGGYTKVGLGTSTPIPTNTFLDVVQMANLDSKLRALPETPRFNPSLPLTEDEEIFGDVASWKKHIRADGSSSSKVKIEDFADENKFEILREIVL